MALTFFTAVIALVLAGCSQGDGVNTSKLEKSFAGSGDELKANMQTVVAAVKAKDYSKAGEALGVLAKDANLNEEQKTAVQDVLKQVQAAMQKMAEGAAEGVGKTAEDLKNALPK